MTLSVSVRRELENMADENYRKFHASLLPNTNNILGIRIPKLRVIARKIARQGEWHQFVESFSHDAYYEEIMLQGMVVGMAQTNFDEQKKYVEMFIPRIDNWAVCDIFCSELKTFVKKGKTTVWHFIVPYLHSSNEFEVRYAIVMLFHYIEESYLPYIFQYADHFSHNGYYARMAMAWLLSICFVKYPHLTIEYLKQSRLDIWTYNKTLQKIIESRRIDKETKHIIRAMKR